MRVGVPAEVTDTEFRVAVTPAGVHELVRAGHEVFIEAGAGAGSSLPDEEFAAAGATIVPMAADAWGEAELVLKVTEPVPDEYPLLTPGQVLFSYLHLAASRECAQALLAQKVTAIGCETVRLPDGSLPLLAPMSEVAGRMAPWVGMRYLPDSSPGARRGTAGPRSAGPGANVVVLGAGISGRNAASVALGLGAWVLLLDSDPARLRAAGPLPRGRGRTVRSTSATLERAVLDADVVIGAVLVPGAKSPVLIGDDLVAQMKPGSVLVDISVDQGGCFESSRATTHSAPTYQVHDSVFYCVPNMPGSVPHTSTYALTHVTLPYALAIANRGWREALRYDEALALGLNTHEGSVTCAPVAQALDLEYVPISEFT